MMMERGLAVDHSRIGRWVLRYAPELNKRIRREVRPPNRSWRVDETYVRVAGVWTYLYRAVDSAGETIDFHVVAQARCRSRQAISPDGAVAVRRRSAAGHQCRWASGVSSGHRRPEGEWRTEQALPMSSVAVHEQCAGTGSPICEEADRGQPL